MNTATFFKAKYYLMLICFQESEIEDAFEQDIELAAINDNSTDFLSKEELGYYFSLE